MMQNRMDTGYRMSDEMINFKAQMTKIRDTRCRFSSCIVHRASCVGSYHASRSERGLTLIEMMIALVVLLLVSLAMMQTALVSIDANMTNVLRDEAVGIAEMTMSQARNTPFDCLASGKLIDTSGTCSISSPSTNTVQRNLRNVPLPYEVRTTINTTLGADAVGIDIRVRWGWKGNTIANGNPYTHTISTIVRRQ